MTTPLPVHPPLTPSEAAEWNLTAAVEEALSESFDADWTSADGARAVIERLRADGYLEPSLKLQLVASTLLEAGKALVARWDTPLWKDVPHTSVSIGRLREAIALAEEHQP